MTPCQTHIPDDEKQGFNDQCDRADKCGYWEQWSSLVDEAVETDGSPGPSPGVPQSERTTLLWQIQRAMREGWWEVLTWWIYNAEDSTRSRLR
jgi:hypothetical protein